MERIAVDLLVIGGGMAGVAAALAGARHGLKTALINDRPVLGGNASSEIRVWVNGATGGRNNRYAREGGIIEELQLENRYKNTDGNAHLWDAILLDAVSAEPLLQVFHLTVGYDCTVEGGRITAVYARQLQSEREVEFVPAYVVEASGDGAVAAKAGAGYRWGREARDEFGEDWAPPVADRKTLGNSLMFYARDAGKPIPFVKPAIAKDFKAETPPRLRRANAREGRCKWWWIEYGGLLDTVHDAAEIHRELTGIVYGVWDYIKNSGKFPEATSLQLEWIGSVPGKRESRRFLGDHILKESEVVAQEFFPDSVAHGGWSIDLHPPKGFFDPENEGSKHWHLAGPYNIPFRTLYSKDLENLFLAGRLASCTHVAFGTTRVMSTLATMGQAAGTAAALAAKHGGLSAREVGVVHLDELQQALLRDDQWIPGVAAHDPADLAPGARVSASTAAESVVLDADLAVRLETERYLRLPAAGRVEAVDLLVEGEAGDVLTVEFWASDRGQNYVPVVAQGQVEVRLVIAGRQWVTVPTAGGGLGPDAAGGILLKLLANVTVGATAQRRPTGAFCYGLEGDPRDGGGMRLDPFTPCYRVRCTEQVYAAANVTNGFARPFGGANSWRSAPLDQHGPQWLELAWQAPQQVREVQLTFNSDLDEHFHNLQPMKGPAVPEMVRDYRILAHSSGQWTEVARADGNYQRLRRHRLSTPVTTDALRVEVLATHGAPCAEIFEVRVY